MTRRRRERSVFDQVVAELGIAVVTVSATTDRAVTAAHEAAHAVLGDIFGVVGDVEIDAESGGEATHWVAPPISGTSTSSHENALVALAGPASEMVVLSRWAVVGTGSAHDFRSAWRHLAPSHPTEPERVARIGALLVEVQAFLHLRWPWVANIAGHLVEQGRLRAGQVQRVLRGVEPDRSYVFSAAIRGTP
ncbi:MAG: hypothetical protein IPM35_27980 [Myxococcales bacterium]|nr:hypothetical protein [Myxococcales bacterium]